ncbi:PQQ-like beta-propeller repeat protein [bacterium]|nr:PQQ-like beta-propeller repeat protein [bacterium]
MIVLAASIMLGVLLCGCGNKGNELDPPDDRQSTASPHPWPMAQANPQRNSLVQVEGTTTGRLLWSIPLGGAQRVLAGMDNSGNSYHLTGLGLLCLDRDGRQRWNHVMPGLRPSGLKVSPAGYALLQSRDDDNLTRFSLISPEGELVAQPGISEVVGTDSGSGFYVILLDQRTAALLDNTGSLHNQHQFPAEISAAPGSRDRRLLPGLAVVRNSYNNDHYFSLDDGASWTTDSDIPSDWNMDARGNLYGLDYQGQSTVLFRRDPDEDVELGEYDGNFHRDPVFTADDGLLIVNTEGNLLKLAADGGILAERDTNMDFSSFLEYAGKVLVTGKDMTDSKSVVRCFGSHFLGLEWQHETEMEIYGIELAPPGDPMIVVSSRNSCSGLDIDWNRQWRHVHDSADYLLVDSDDCIYAMGLSTASVYNSDGGLMRNVEFPAGVHLSGNEPCMTRDRRIAFYWISEPGMHISKLTISHSTRIPTSDSPFRADPLCHSPMICLCLMTRAPCTCLPATAERSPATHFQSISLVTPCCILTAVLSS